MANNNETMILDEEVKQDLDTAIAEYFDCNNQYNSLKTNRAVYNDYIKELFKNNSLSTYVTSDTGIKATITTSNKPKWKEEELIEYLKPFNIPGLIKTKEYVDMEVLEDSIYHNMIDAANLAPFKEDNFTETLRVTQSKRLLG